MNLEYDDECFPTEDMVVGKGGPTVTSGTGVTGVLEFVE